LRAALMLMWWPPTVKKKVSAWAAVESPIASPIIAAKQNSRVILASRFKQQAGWCENNTLNVTWLTRTLRGA
jgi:hypothetical protein